MATFCRTHCEEARLEAETGKENTLVLWKGEDIWAHSGNSEDGEIGSEL